MYGIVATSLNVPAVSYTAAKHGVIGLTRADAIAYAPKGIRINAICPGYVDTPLIRSAMQTDTMQREITKIPVGRVADMDEIADHITFLASPLSSYMYGSAMVADGCVSLITLISYLNSNIVCTVALLYTRLKGRDGRYDLAHKHSMHLEVIKISLTSGI